METFVGDTVKLVLKTNIDLTNYTDLRIRYQKPDDSTGEWTATVSAVNSTWMEYTTLESDLDLPGTWVVQAFALATGISLHGKWVDFVVFDPIHLLPLIPLGAAWAGYAAAVSELKL